MIPSGPSVVIVASWEVCCSSSGNPVAELSMRSVNAGGRPANTELSSGPIKSIGGGAGRRTVTEGSAFEEILGVWIIEVAASPSPGTDDSPCASCACPFPRNDEIMVDPISTAVEVGVAGEDVVVDRKSATELSRRGASIIDLEVPVAAGALSVPIVAGALV